MRSPTSHGGMRSPVLDRKREHIADLHTATVHLISPPPFIELIPEFKSRTLWKSTVCVIEMTSQLLQQVAKLCAKLPLEATRKSNSLRNHVQQQLQRYENATASLSPQDVTYLTKELNALDSLVSNQYMLKVRFSFLWSG
jgi:hypothetical protein